MRLLLDEMYPARLAAALAEVGLEAVTVAGLGLAGASDPEVFSVAREAGRVIVTENVGDYVALAADCTLAGGHHPGILIALSTRFSRRPSGAPALVHAITAADAEILRDRVVYLIPPR